MNARVRFCADEQRARAAPRRCSRQRRGSRRTRVWALNAVARAAAVAQCPPFAVATVRATSRKP